MAVIAVIIGFFIANSTVYSFPLLFAIISVFVIASAGIVLNDYFDFESDQVNAPQRPLPSGKISKKNALLFSIILFAFGLLLAFFINFYCFLIAVINIVLEISYAVYLKKTFFIGNLVDSFFVFSAFLYGAFIAPNNLPLLLLFAVLAFLANVGREIFGDLEDVEGDRKLNARTLPIVLGEKKSRLIASLFIISAVILSILPFLVGRVGIYYLLVIFIADLIFVYSLFQKPRQNQVLTRIAMLFALIAFIVGAL